MHRFPRLLLVFFVFTAFAHSAIAAASERRLALVIGNGSYGVRALPSAVNDAAVIAQTLKAAGFDVTSQRDLDEARLRRSFGDFLIRVKNAGPDAVVVVYFAGLGLQSEGENYLLPVDAQISQPSDLVRHALPLSEQTLSLAALAVKASFVIVDGARANPFLLAGRPAASGLAWTEPEANQLIAFNATPGTVAPDSPDGHGAYASALAEMIRQGGLGPEDLFDRVRLRVNELTGGAQVPWDASNVQARFDLSEAAVGAQPRADAPERTAWMRAQPMRKLSPQDAYWTALLRDTFDGYAEFLAEYWNDPMAKQIEALLAVRREAITWRRSYQANVADAYWTYLELYPHGPHVADAERMLTRLAAAITPPLKFRRLDYDVPPPLPAEVEFIDRPVLSLGDPEFAFAPVKRPPASFLQPPPSEQQVSMQTAAPGPEQGPAPPPLPPSRTPGLAGRVAVSAGGPTNAATKTDKPTMREGQGGSLSLSGAAGLGIERPINSNQSSRSVSRIGDPGSAAPAAMQSSPSEQANASPGPPLPAWASFRETRISGLLSPAASNRQAEPLFVSSALAPVLPLPAPRRAGTAMVANPQPGPHRPLLATAPTRLSGGSTQPPTTGSIAAGRPKAVTLPAPAQTSIAPPGTRSAAQLAGPQAPTSRVPAVVPGTRAASLTPSAVNRPKLAPGAAQSPKAADQTARHAARKENPEAPISLAPGPASATSAAQSEKNPCKVSNGRLDCGD